VRRTWLLALFLVLACGTARAAGGGSGATLLSDRFTGPDGLITNERVVDDEDSPAPVSPTWIVTSGSLLRRGGWAWTGVPDATSPDVCSCVTTGSAIFRMVSRRDDLRDVAFSLRLRTDRLVHTARTPALDVDGAHLMLRYASEAQLYYVSVARRDGVVAIKRKRAGGADPVNGGTYTTLAQAGGHPIVPGRVVRIRATVRDTRSGVALALWIDGRRVLATVDRDHPLRAAGRVGLRLDNDDARFDDVVVSRL
jgi:hypothetical protein